MSLYVIFRPDGTASGPFTDVTGHEGVAVAVPHDFSWATYAADLEAMTVAPTQAPLWAALRAERDRILDDLTDRWLLDDFPGRNDPAIHAARLAYRQALRDLPETTLDPANPEWPEMPE